MFKYYHYINLIVKPYFILKYNFNNIYELPELKKIKINLVLNLINSEYNPIILDSINLLEKLFYNFPFFFKFYSYYFGKKKIYLLILSLTLRKKFLYNFFIFFFNFINYFLQLKKIKLKYFLDNHGNFSFIIKNLFPFFFFKENFYYNNYYIQIIIYTKKKKKKMIILY